MEYMGIEYLRRKLASKVDRIRTRYDYYEMKKRPVDYGISTPPNLRNISNPNGWCAKAVDELADRLKPLKFIDDYFGMAEIYRQNNADILFDSAILSALICACSFLYVYGGEDERPKIQVIDGQRATGIIDDVTRFLKEGYAILEVDVHERPTVEAYFTAESTDYYINGKYSYSVPNPTLYPLLVPIIYRPDAKRPFGHSRISRDCMGYQDNVIRTLKRLGISEEFYSIPQKYVIGMDEDVQMEKWSAAMSSMLQIGKSEDGTNPQVGQFSQQSIAPYMDSIKTQASLFAGATGLTLDDMGFPSANPSSDDAIKLQHAGLHRTAKKAQRTFAVGFINAGFLAVCLQNGQAFTRDRIADTTIMWEPLFEPGASTLSAIGDGVSKINTAIEGYVDADGLYQLTGIKGAE